MTCEPASFEQVVHLMQGSNSVQKSNYVKGRNKYAQYHALFTEVLISDQQAIDLIEVLASALQIYAHHYYWLNPSIVDRAGIARIACNFALDVSLSMSNSTVRLRACAALVIDQILSANMCKLQIQAAHLLLRARTTPAGMSLLSSAILIIPHPTECPTVCQFCNPHHRTLSTQLI